MRKGFVYTLESIVASTLVLSMVVVVLPEAGPEPSPDFSSLESGLEALETRGKLDRDLSVNYVRAKTEQYVPTGFNHTAIIYKSDNNLSTASAGDSIYLNGKGNAADIQLWIESANGLNVSFNGVKIFEDIESPGYRESTLPSTEGRLNFTGSGTADFSFNTYQKFGSSPEKNQVRSKNMPTFYKRNREVQIKLW